MSERGLPVFAGGFFVVIGLLGTRLRKVIHSVDERPQEEMAW
ncbi:hypothetical protein [Fredinandcohnia sp. 179-A 10B2 NHS]